MLAGAPLKAALANGSATERRLPGPGKERKSLTKLIIQIPCLNEEETLPATLAALPREVAGIDAVEWLVIDDGSTDRTAEVAAENGVEHVLVLPRNMGLAAAFMQGLDMALRKGADVIVNTDADNQYCAQDIPKLVEPILSGRADYVIGARPIDEVEHFSRFKKILQKLGSYTVRHLSGVDVPDAPSGFRAISRHAAYKLNVFNSFTYTLETLIQAGNTSIKTISVPIRVNGETRPSRLFRSIPAYVSRSLTIMLGFFFIYRALSVLMTIAAILFAAGFLVGLRFLYLNFVLEQSGHVQSVMLAVLLMVMGVTTGLSGYLAGLIGINRRLLEQIKEIARKVEHRIEEK